MQSEKKNKKKVCATCGGTGQIAFFQGESRFLLSQEECPACFGIGHEISLDDSANRIDSDEKQSD